MRKVLCSPLRVLAVVGALLLMSCANKSMVRLEKLAKPAEEGKYEAALDAVRDGQDDLYGDNSTFLYEFDMGLLFHYNNQWDSSIVHLANAEKILEELYAVSVTNTAVATVTNDNARPYRSRPFEIAWMHSMQILNYLAKGNEDDAVVQVRRAQIALQALEQQDPGAFHDEGSLRYIAAMAYEQQGASDDALISYLKAMQAYGKDASVTMPGQVFDVSWNQLKAGGRESDLAPFDVANPPTPDKTAGLGESASELVLVGYAGRGPVLDELRFWGTYVRDGVLVFHYKDPESGKEITDAWPAPILPSAQGGGSGSGTTLHINFAIPKMLKRPSVTGSFAVRDTAAGYLGHTEAVADVQNLLGQALSDERKATITRTVIRVAIRTLAAQTAKNQVRTDNPLINLLTNIGTDVFADQLEDADLRTGLFFPQTLQMLRLPMQPGVHDVTIDVLDQAGRKIGEQTYSGIQVRKGRKTFLFVSSLR